MAITQQQQAGFREDESSRTSKVTRSTTRTYKVHGGSYSETRLSQRMAVPELVDLLESRCDFEDYASMPERLSLVAVLMLAALVQAHFECM